MEAYLLERLVGRPGALENQERWRTRRSGEPGALEDQALWRTSLLTLNGQQALGRTGLGPLGTE